MPTDAEGLRAGAAGAAERGGAVPGRRGAIVRLALYAAALLAAGLVVWRLGLFDVHRVWALMRRARTTRGAGSVFVLGFAALGMLSVPTSGLTLIGGAMFGFARGSLLSWIGGMLGALVQYWLTRLAAGGAIRALLRPGSKAMAMVQQGNGFWAQVRLRLLPVLPYSAVNIAAALVPVPLRPYLLSTAIGLVPGTLIFAYFASALTSNAPGARTRAVIYLGLVSAVLFALSFLPTIARRLRRRHD